MTELTDAKLLRTREAVEAVRAELMTMYAIVQKGKGIKV